MREITLIKERYYTVKYIAPKVYYGQVITKPEDWVELKDISKRLQGAIISSEDGKFYEHPGYDIEEIHDAIEEGLVKKKKKLRGASTITQQLIKNLFFTTERSFLRKAKEMVLTLWIEEHVGKKKILETYLNIIEYGDGLYGIKKAAKYYFNKSPRALNARESAFLAMLLPSPKRYAQSFKRKELTHFAQKSIHSILFKMLQGGYIGIEEYYQSIESRFTWEKYAADENTSDDLGDF